MIIQQNIKLTSTRRERGNRQSARLSEKMKEFTVEGSTHSCAWRARQMTKIRLGTGTAGGHQKQACVGGRAVKCGHFMWNDGKGHG